MRTHNANQSSIAPYPDDSAALRQVTLYDEQPPIRPRIAHDVPSNAGESQNRAKYDEAKRRREEVIEQRKLLVYQREASRAEQRKGRVWVRQHAYQIYLRNRALAIQAEAWRRQTEAWSSQATTSTYTTYWYEWVPVSGP